LVLHLFLFRFVLNSKLTPKVFVRFELCKLFILNLNKNYFITKLIKNILRKGHKYGAWRGLIRKAPLLHRVLSMDKRLKSSKEYGFYIWDLLSLSLIDKSVMQYWS